MARSWAPGAVLILIGLGLLALQAFELRREYALALIGAAFIAAYAVWRFYGLLVPGGILLGLGVGVALEPPRGGSGAFVLLGLGVGFGLIYLIDAAVRGPRTALWWPLIPAAIFVVIGGGLAAERIPEVADLLRWWPLLLIALGVGLILARLRE